MLEKLTVLKSKLESLLQNKEDKDKYKQTQSQTRKEIGTDQEFAYYNLEFGSGMANTRSAQVTSQTVQTDYKVYNQGDGSLVTTISKIVAEDLKVNDLTKILGKSWIIKSIDKTIREIKVVQDTGSTARPGGPV
jgi:Lhr-like helicase